MSFPENDQDFDAMLTDTFGPPPSADIDTWRRRYPETLAWLNPVRISLVSQKRRRMRRIALLAAAAAGAICVWLGLMHVGTNGTGTSVFAQAAEQIQKAKDITWTTTVYCRTTSKDGRRHWYDLHVFKKAYKAPGLYRTTAFDPKGNVLRIEITDAVRMKMLTLTPSAKSAIMAEVRWYEKDPEGPFRDVLQQAIKDPDLQFVERRKTAAGDVNVFRRFAQGRPWFFFDYSINQKTKQLVEYRINQNEKVSLADYENDPMRSAAPEEKSSVSTIVGSITKDIAYDAHLDDSLFRFDVPDGYAIKTQERHLVTEQEMLDFVRLLVEANRGVFPDQIMDIPCDLANKYHGMPKSGRPAEIQKLIEMADHYDRILRFGERPMRAFLKQNAAWISFRYLGKGVKLGDKDTIVCWYKLKDAKQPNTYRVVYGDLSVKDVAATDLPLPVEP